MLEPHLCICEALGMKSSQAVVAQGIRLHLHAVGKSQAWLARRLGESSSWLSRRMSGATNFDIDELDRIAEVLRTTVENLLAAALADPDAAASSARKGSDRRGRG